ncbi:MAG: NAD(P)/FAD-dependent oxidoreductase [Proteobacteria bacterium]|nr:NAD(P)/FAD-dependent oxidoreductase [Pseudomonadota bacterium]
MQGTNQHTVIVGSGFAGLAMAIRLKKAGIDDFTILEQAGEVGGTWRDNTYPGAACDVPSPVYSFSFEANPNWSSKFSPQKEIYEYLKHCAKKYAIYPHIRFHNKVEESQFNSESGLWTVSIKAQASIDCRFLILCSGGLSRPAYPKIPGIDSFKGALFHSAAWDHKFPLENSRVAVIGTGASSIQIVPAIIDKVKQLNLFQRTPAWILPKSERKFGKLERFFLAKIPAYHYFMRKYLYWQFELRAIGLLKPALMRIPEKEARKFIDREIRDPKLKAKLIPNYTMGCKRILLSNDFYRALNHKNLKLIDQSIERILPNGILTKDGQIHELDALICATGFQVAEASAPFSILGLNKQSLEKTWSQGAEGYLGVSISGFPNFFSIVGPNSGLGHNSIVFIIEAQAQYIFDALAKIKEAKLKYVEIKREKQDQYNQELNRLFKGTVWTEGKCVSWYHTNSGKNTTIFPGFSFQLRLRTRKFDPEAYHLTRLEQDARRS